MEAQSKTTWTTRCVCVLCIVIPIVWLMWPGWNGKQSLVFRDAGHFYYPLYEFIHSQWLQGRFPTWNPYDNLGQPLLANVPSAVCYPPKIIFLLPMDYPTNYHLYIVSHLLLASVTCYGCARGWQISRPGAALSSIAYVLSGSVLSQYCNVIYLVGAAWLPLALWAGRCIWWNPNMNKVLIWGGTVSMMILGGDPQTGYHATLALLLLGAVIWWRRFRQRQVARRSHPVLADQQTTLQDDCKPMAGLYAATLAIGLSFALPAVQLLPSIEWARHTDRLERTQPFTIWQLVTQNHVRDGTTAEQTSPCAWYQGILGAPPTDTHQAHAYQFSLGPWRYAELVWPNLGGCQYPIHRRWWNAIPAEGRVWAPSIYLGMMPLLLAFSTWKWRSSEANVQWLWSLVAVFGLASLGEYGVGWLVREICYLASGGTHSGPPIGRPVGGVYWWMFTWLPGYSVFRYPAKLFVVTTLGLSLLAGYGWDRLPVHARVVKKMASLLAVCTLVGIVLGLISIPFWNRFLTEQVPPDLVFGRFDAWRSWCDMMMALGQTFILCCLYVIALRPNIVSSKHFQQPQVDEQTNQESPDPVPINHNRSGRYWRFGLLVVTAIELVFAHSWMVQFAPSDLWQTSTFLSSATESSKVPLAHTCWLRTPTTSSYPSQWLESTGSVNRHISALKWDRETLFPNFHLQYPLRQLGVRGAAMPADFRATMSSLKGSSPSSNKFYMHWLDACAVNHFLQLETDTNLPTFMKETPFSVPVDLSPTIRWLTRPTSISRAWAVPIDNVQWLPSPDRPLAEVADKILRQVRSTRSPTSNLRNQPFAFGPVNEVTRESIPEPERVAEGIYSFGTPQIRMTRDDPDQVDLEVFLTEASLVVLADQYYPGWNLEVVTKGDDQARTVPIVRTNLVMRGAVLPAGSHRLTFQYQPVSVRIGAIISLLSWTGLLICFAVSHTRFATGRRKREIV